VGLVSGGSSSGSSSLSVISGFLLLDGISVGFSGFLSLFISLGLGSNSTIVVSITLLGDLLGGFLISVSDFDSLVSSLVLSNGGVLGIFGFVIGNLGSIEGKLGSVPVS